MKLHELSQIESLLDSDLLLSQSLGINYKETRQQQDLYFKAKNDLRYTPRKSDAGSWVMQNGVWVPGYSKTETDNLVGKKFDYDTKSVNTNPTTLPDGAYKWTWNSGNAGMPFANDGEYQAACIIINNTRRLVLRKDNTSRVFEWQDSEWSEGSGLAQVIEKKVVGRNSYRKWSDGFIENFGYYQATAAGPWPVSLLKSFSTNTYSVVGSQSDDGNPINLRIRAYSGTQILINNSAAAGISYYAYGY